MNKLIEIAKIQSIDSSNQLEGISTSNACLKKIIKQKASPKTRDEKEITGYRDVLEIINNAYDTIKISSNYILHLHKILLNKTDISTRGKFKNTDNCIEEIREDATKFIRFKPPSSFQTPDAINEICNQYNQEIKNNQVNKLILLIIFIPDFLCIHPFNDGNGRMSRILTLLLMY